MMTKTQEALVNRNEKHNWEKDATAATFIDHTKQAIEVQRMESIAKLFAEENHIMFTNLSIIDPKQRS
jgi:hypothetical protein